MATDVKTKYNAFPSDFAPLSDKKEDSYGLEYVQAIYATHLTDVPSGDARVLEYIENREFAEGTYDTDIYSPRGDLAGEASFLNIDRSAINRIPTVVNNMVGKMVKKFYRFQCNPTDVLSRAKYDGERDRMRADRFLQGKSAESEALTGAPLVQKGAFIAEDDEEAEIHLQMNFKLDESVAMELAMEWIMENNDFNNVHLPKVYRDIFTDKKSAIFRYYDQNKNIKVERWDHLKLAVPYSVHDDFRDVPYQGLLPVYTIGAIAKLNPNFTDEELYTIAKNNSGENNNARWDSEAWFDNYGDFSGKHGSTAGRQFQNFNIKVVNFFFLSPLETTKTVKVSKSGRTRIEPKENGYVSEKGNEVIKKRRIVRFEGFWVPDTDIIWDYKMTEDMDRDSIAGGYSPETELPCKIIMPNKIGIQNMSDVRKMIPFEKQLNLAWEKLQQFLIEAMPPGMAINQNALLDVVEGAGEGKALPTDWTKLYKQTGNIIFTDRDEEGNPINIPFKELQGGISSSFREFLGIMDYCINKMNEVIGFNAAVDASTPSADALVGTNEMAASSTYDALRPSYLAVMNLVEASGKRIALMVQDSLRLGNKDFKNALEAAIGKANVDVLISGRDTPLSTSAISVEVQPDDDEMVSIENALLRGIQQGSITTGQEFMVRQQMKKNFKLSAQMLSYYEKKNAKDRQKEAMELSQQNGQVQIQSAQAASEAQANLDAIITENKIKLLTAEAELKGLQAEEDHKDAIELQKLKNAGGLEEARVGAQKAVSVQAISSGGKEDVEHLKHESKIKSQAHAHEHENMRGKKEPKAGK